MNAIKKMFLYTFIILFLISVHNDLTIGTSLSPDTDQQNKPQIVEQKDRTVLKVQVSKGETVLSIAERINNQDSNHLDIPQMLDDFRALNPGVEPTHIKPGEYYYFPLY